MSQLHDPKAAIIRALAPGATAQVLLAFLAYPQRALGTQDLQTLTGKSGHTIIEALRALELLGLVQCHARYRGWLLTTTARQMLLGETPATPEPTLSTMETQNLRLPPGSSSSVQGEPELPHLTTTTTTTPETQNLRFPLCSDLVDLLVDRCGTPPAMATAAIQAAQQRTDDPLLTRWQILRWLSYSLSADGHSINNPGAFVASRIKAGIPCPSWHSPDKYTDLDDDIRAAQDRLDAQEEP